VKEELSNTIHETIQIFNEGIENARLKSGTPI